MIFVKNSSHSRLSATAKRRKGALLMVHSARTFTVPLRHSGSRFSFVMRYFLSRELKTSFDVQAGAMPVLVHRVFSLFPCPCGLASFAYNDAHYVYLLHRHCMDLSTAQALHGSIGSTTNCSLCFAFGKLRSKLICKTLALCGVTCLFVGTFDQIRK